MIYKEWLKTRWLISGVCASGISVLVYIFITLGRVFRHIGMVDVWDVIINRNNVLYAELKYYPLVFGALLGLAQFIPEIQKKRLKLTLHLPISQKNAYFSMQIYGLFVLFISFAVQLLILYIFSIVHFPKEIVENVFLTLLPWYSAGIIAYLFTALISLEPTWLRRIAYLFVAVGVLYFAFLREFPATYEKIWWLFLLLPIYLLAFPWLSIERFKKGVQ